MRFLFMLKIDVLGMSRERHLPDGPLEDMFRTFLQAPKTIKQLFNISGPHLVK